MQVFFFVCETPPLLFVLSCSWLYRRRWDSSSWFRAALDKIGRAWLVLIFCGHRLRLHPSALLFALQLLRGSLQHTHLPTFHILKIKCSALVCLLAEYLLLSTRIRRQTHWDISIRVLSKRYSAKRHTNPPHLLFKVWNVQRWVCWRDPQSNWSASKKAQGCSLNRWPQKISTSRARPILSRAARNQLEESQRRR